MRKFDINLAKAGKPVCTRDGRKARIISCSLRNKNFPIAAIIEDEEENVYQFEANGVCDEHDENLDLMMFPEKRSGWVNVYKECDGEYYVEKVVYKIKGHAVENASSQNYVGTVRIEFYE